MTSEAEALPALLWMAAVTHGWPTASDGDTFTAWMAAVPAGGRNPVWVQLVAPHVPNGYRLQMRLPHAEEYEPPPGAPELAQITVTHITSAHLMVRNRYIRQRCGWCGAALVEHDVGPAGPLMGPDGLPLHAHRVFPDIRLVRHQGDQLLLLPQGAQLPQDFCGWADIATPEDITGGPT